MTDPVTVDPEEEGFTASEAIVAVASAAVITAVVAAAWWKIDDSLRTVRLRDRLFKKFPAKK